MVTLFITPSCISCRRAKAWFEVNQIPYKERNILSEKLTVDEIKNILHFTEDGTDEIISTKSKAFQKLNINIDSLLLRELYTLIEENPGLLRKPLILDEKRLQVGFNEEELRCFLPRKMRVFQLDEVHSFIEDAL
ncbi:transcriptional regulator Spx [Bacillus sp. ISL-40]|uniref:transcriptional regulator SpxA n=1 Tax=unclassified Bacillus (in: firmicutes) TaxID=185979 RepID=UPI001BE81F69|nr:MULTISPECIES: transcriptional regulator SpxA [unclassified Bacillus (in: firmicutes)]MBT2698958.1 transcriptional regulator Spx [Bacillus sp. ISL-40]MBT2742642.1 transcriptional regulator Spx [Bacillus sp. ISL-77]